MKKEFYKFLAEHGLVTEFNRNFSSKDGKDYRSTSGNFYIKQNSLLKIKIHSILFQVRLIGLNHQKNGSHGWISILNGNVKLEIKFTNMQYLKESQVKRG